MVVGVKYIYFIRLQNTKMALINITNQFTHIMRFMLQSMNINNTVKVNYNITILAANTMLVIELVCWNIKCYQ